MLVYTALMVKDIEEAQAIYSFEHEDAIAKQFHPAPFLCIFYCRYVAIVVWPFGAIYTLGSDRQKEATTNVDNLPLPIKELIENS